MGKRQMGRQHRGMDGFELHVMIAEDREEYGNSLDLLAPQFQPLNCDLKCINPVSLFVPEYHQRRNLN